MMSRFGGILRVKEIDTRLSGHRGGPYRGDLGERIATSSAHGCGLWEHLEYGRSRLRICRGWAFNALLTLVMLNYLFFFAKFSLGSGQILVCNLLLNSILLALLRQLEQPQPHRIYEDPAAGTVDRRNGKNRRDD